MQEFGPFPRVRSLAALLLATALAIGSADALAQRQGDTAPAVSSWAAQILPGEPTSVSGRNFKPNSKITLSSNGTQLNAKPFVADEEGRFRGNIQVPGNATRGTLPVAVAADGTAVTDLKLRISERLPLTGAEQFTVRQNKLRPGLYQLALNDEADTVYVTSAFGPERQSSLMKVDAQTLEIIDSTAPPASETWGQEHREGERTPPPVISIFGAGADPTGHTIWVSNTINDTVAVYRQDDLSLLRQFEPDLTPHARAVQVDGERGKAYVTGSVHVSVFDTQTLRHLKDIKIASTQANAAFNPIGLALDAASGTLYVASEDTPEVASISTADDSVRNVWALAASSLRDLAWDARNGRLLAADYRGDNLLVIDPAQGRLVHSVGVGASPLSVAWDPASGNAFVANRGAGTVAVVDPAAGKLVANLAIGSYPNHLIADGQGSVYVVNKAQDQDDPKGDMITRIKPKEN